MDANLRTRTSGRHTTPDRPQPGASVRAHRRARRAAGLDRRLALGGGHRPVLRRDGFGRHGFAHRHQGRVGCQRARASGHGRRSRPEPASAAGYVVHDGPGRRGRRVVPSGLAWCRGFPRPVGRAGAHRPSRRSPGAGRKPCPPPTHHRARWCSPALPWPVGCGRPPLGDCSCAASLLSAQGQETILDAGLQRAQFTLGAGVAATVVLVLGHRILRTGRRTRQAPR
jgi:hypothetical protein